jgi:ABC-type lipoprotein release transport system permease subunit
MDLFTLLRIAARNLTRHRRRSVIGLMALFFALLVMVLMKGFTNSISRFARDTIVEVHAGALQIHRQGFAKSIVSTPLDLDLPADATFLARLRAVPHVRAVTARIPAGAVVSAHDRSAFAAVLAFDPIEEVKVCPKRFAELTAGKPLAPDNPTGSALTQLLLTRLGAKQGEKVVLLSSDRDGVMNAVEVEVTGTLKDAGLLAAEKKLAYIPLASAQELLRMPERALELAVSIDDLDRLDEVAGALRTLLGPGYEVLTWRDLAGFDKDASEMREQQNLTGVLPGQAAHDCHRRCRAGGVLSGPTGKSSAPHRSPVPGGHMMRMIGLGMRNLLRNRGRSSIAAVALLIGVGLLIFGKAQMNGMLKAIVEDNVLSKIGAIQIYHAGYLNAEPDDSGGTCGDPSVGL